MYRKMDEQTPGHDREDDRRNQKDPFDVSMDFSISFPNPNYNGPKPTGAFGEPEPSAQGGHEYEAKSQ